MKYVDPEGKVIETAWDIANVVMDACSLYDNILQKNYKAAAVDAGAFVLDAAATALPAVPAGFGTALKAARTSEKAVKAARTSEKAVKTVKATKYNYRKLLQKATGKEEKGFEAHHTLPQKYRKQFEKLEINIDEPGNVVWRQTKEHQKKSHILTKKWDKFFSKHEHPTIEQISTTRDNIEMEIFNNKYDEPLK